MKNTIENKYIRQYAPYIFWCMIVFVTKLLLMEVSNSLPSFPYLDKIIHASLFASLTLLGLLAYPNYPKWLYTGLVIYGATTEIMQDFFTDTRFASVYDWFADVTGIIIAVFLLKTTLSHLNTKSSDA